MNAHKWEFSSRFRRKAFGWRSQAPMKRIKEALAEIKKVARKDPELAAEGTVMKAAYSAGINASEIKINKLISAEANNQFVKSVLIRYLNK